MMQLSTFENTPCGTGTDTAATQQMDVDMDMINKKQNVITKSSSRNKIKGKNKANHKVKSKIDKSTDNATVCRKINKSDSNLNSKKGTYRDSETAIDNNEDIKENNETKNNESDHDNYMRDDTNENGTVKNIDDNEKLEIDSKITTKKEEHKKPLTLSFIHKLYSMLEEKSMDDLIWWHENESNFFVRPNEDFINKLSNYFKHANIASFIRQLNMYGFHKVDNSNNNLNVDKTDVDDNNSKSNESSNLDSSSKTKLKTKSSNPNIQVWEFKHTSGVFKKGNIDDLSSIKRRSFKNSLSDRDGNMKLTYDLPPQVPTQTDNYGYSPQVTNNMHQTFVDNQQQHYQLLPPPPPAPASQQLSEQQQHSQQQILTPISNQSSYQSQQQHQISTPCSTSKLSYPHVQQESLKSISSSNQSPVKLPNNSTTASVMEDRMNTMMQSHLNQVEADKNFFSFQIREMQQVTTNLQQKVFDLNNLTENLIKVNTIYKEELSSINYNFVDFMDVIKEHFSHIQPTSNGLLADIESFRSKILQRSASCDMNLKNVFYQFNQPPNNDLNATTDSQNRNQSLTITDKQYNQMPPSQLTSHYVVQDHLSLQNRQSLVSSQSLQPQVVLAPQPPQQLAVQQIRQGSIPQQNMFNIHQQSMPLSSLNEAQRHPSTTSVTSNPYFNAAYQPVSTVFGYYQEYPQQQHLSQPQPQPHPPAQVSHHNQSLHDSQQVPVQEPQQQSASQETSQPKTSNRTWSLSNSRINGTISYPSAQIQNNVSGTNLQKLNNSSTEDAPFLQKEIRYNVSVSSGRSSGRSRNPSVYDPLQPLPFPNVGSGSIIGMPINQQQNMNMAINGNNIQPVNVNVPFYPANQNTSFTNVDPNIISRQYSLTQMYSPVVSYVNIPNNVPIKTNNTTTPTTTDLELNNNGNTDLNNNNNNNNNNKRFSATNFISNQHGIYLKNTASPSYKINDSNFNSKNNSRNGSLSISGSRNGSFNTPGLNISSARNINMRSPSGRVRDSTTYENVRNSSSISFNNKEKRDDENKIAVKTMLNNEDKQQNGERYDDGDEDDEEGDGEEHEDQDDDDDEIDDPEVAHKAKRTKL